MNYINIQTKENKMDNIMIDNMDKLKSIINEYLSHWEWKDEFEKSMIFVAFSLLL